MKIFPKFILVILTMVLCVFSAFALSACGNKTGEKVSVYCFGDYIDPILIRDFEKETGIKVVYSTFDTNEELYPVIKNNGADYDVICASDYMIEKLRKEGHLSELDKEEIPNLKNVLPEFMKKVEVFDPNNKYAVPHTWGTMGIMYNKKSLGKGDSIESWDDLWKGKYKGKVVMPDSMRDAIGIGLKRNGYSLNTKDVHQLLAAQYDMIQQKPLVYKYVNDSARDLIIGGSADLAVVWNGEFLYSKAENKNIDFVVPNEGSEEFIDAWAITAKGRNKKNANKWINFMLSKKASIANFNYLTYTIPNKYVYDNIDKLIGELDEQVYNGKGIIKNNGVIFPSNEVLERCEMLRDLGPDGDDLYTDIWKKFKAN